MGCWDDGGGWVRVGVRGWAISSSGRTAPRSGNMSLSGNGSLGYYNWFVYQFWRFQFVQQEVAKVAQTAIEFPPMQKGASFNLAAVKEQIEKAIQAQAGK